MSACACSVVCSPCNSFVLATFYARKLQRPPASRCRTSVPHFSRELSKHPAACKPPTSTPRLWILGASARAAARSARRSGFAPVTCDRFADADLQLEAWWRPQSPTQSSLTIAPGNEPWMYVGPLENSPGAARSRRRLRPDRVLWGNSGARPAKRSRPQGGAAMGFRFRACIPGVSLDGRSRPAWQDGCGSAAGRPAAPRWDGRIVSTAAHSTGSKFCPGKPYSAVFLLGGKGGHSQLVGVSRQLSGDKLELAFAAGFRFSIPGRWAPFR